MNGVMDISLLIRYFKGRIAITWFLVLLENVLMALIPLFIGRAIDALLDKRPEGLWEIAIVMLALVIVATVRRLYDTRSYGTMRVRFGTEFVSRMEDRPVSLVNARLNMSREMVDFLEEHVPELLTAVVQLSVSIILLWSFGMSLGLSALVAVIVLALVYGLCHRRFYRLNGMLNAQTEQQVAVLEQREKTSLIAHLKRLRRAEVHLSDTEAILYAVMYSGIFAFLLTNLWLAAAMPGMTAGVIFAVLSYSWEFAESGITLPNVLQQWSRLSEIRQRLNED